MASLFSTKSPILAPVRVTQLSPPVVQKTNIRISGGSYATGYRKLWCVHQNNSSQPDEHNHKLDLEKAFDNEQLYREKLKAYIKKLYNTSQKILMVCHEDFTYAHNIASTLGDANEMKRLYAKTLFHMYEMSNLGATIVFDVDIRNNEDSWIKHAFYDVVLVDMPEL